MIGFHERNSSAMIIQSWDTATKDSEQANYSVCTTWLYHDKKYYLVDVFRERVDYPALKAAGHLRSRNFTPQRRSWLRMLASAVDLSRSCSRLGLPAVAVKPVFDKRTRMSIQSGKLESGQVFLPTVASWLDELEAELFAFPGGRYDDQIDSISQALAYEIFSGEWMTDAALKGYGNLIEGLCFDRLFSGG